MGNFVSKKFNRKKKYSKFQETSRAAPQPTKPIQESSKAVPEPSKPVQESSRAIEEPTKVIQGSSTTDGQKRSPTVPPAKLYIIYYSMYGHVERLAQEIKKGADTIEGVEATLWQVPETLSDEILGKMGAPPKSDVPIIEVNQLPDADAFLFGFPTRFGMMPAQFKAFFDATGGLWREQKLAGKAAGLFYSTGSQGGGQETTAWTTITQIANHAMLYVPTGYTSGPGMVNLDVVKGGSPYGAGTIAGAGSLADKGPIDLELEHAFHQGKYTAGIAKKLKGIA